LLVFVARGEGRRKGKFKLKQGRRIGKCRLEGKDEGDYCRAKGSRGEGRRKGKFGLERVGDCCRAGGSRGDWAERAIGGDR